MPAARLEGGGSWARLSLDEKLIVSLSLSATLPYWSRAVTVKLNAVPVVAVAGAATPRLAAAPGVTATAAVPLIEEPVSVPVTDWVPLVRRVAEKVPLPWLSGEFAGRIAWESVELTCTVPEGAFYVYPNVSAYLGRPGLNSSIDVANRLLHDAHVVTVPGEGFGTREHIRLSYATSSAVLKEALARMKNFFASV